VSREEWEALQRGYYQIGDHYETMNRLLSWNFIPRWWKEIAAEVSGRERILEVACGPGGLARELRGSFVVNTDPNPTMVAATRRQTGGKNAYLRCIAESLPFKTGSMDAVVSSFAFRNFLDRRGAIEEFHRVLRPGGVAVIAEITKTNPVMSRLMSRYLRTLIPVFSRVLTPGLESRGDPWMLLPQTYEEIQSIDTFERMMGEVGFASVSVRKLATGAALVLKGVKS